MKVDTSIVLNAETNKELLLGGLISGFFKKEDSWLDEEFIPKDSQVEIKIVVKGNDEREVDVEKFIGWIAEELDVLDEKMDKLRDVFRKVFEI